MQTMLRCLILVFVLLARVFPGQTQVGEYVVPDYKGMAESFFSLNDSILRAEVGSFTFTGSLVGLSGRASLREFELYSQTSHTITLALDQKKVHISRGPFFASLHHIEYFGPQQYVYRIDGRYFWGFDGKMPGQRLVNVHVFDGHERLELPARAIRDIYEPNFCGRRSIFGRQECYSKAFLSEDGERLYIYMRNSRIPSLYEVTWIIRKGKFLGRVVDYAY